MDYKKIGFLELVEEVQPWDFEDFDNGPAVETTTIKFGTLEQFKEHITECLKLKFGE